MSKTEIRYWKNERYYMKEEKYIIDKKQTNNLQFNKCTRKSVITSLEKWIMVSK